MQFGNKGWILAGLLFGGMMFAFMTFVKLLLMGEEFTWLSVAIGVPIWTVSGLVWGYFMKRTLVKQRLKEQEAKSKKDNK